MASTVSVLPIGVDTRDRRPLQPRADQVCLPTFPSTTRPLAFWKARTAASVSLPKMPSVSSLKPLAFNRVCSRRTASPLSLRLSRGRSGSRAGRRRGSAGRRSDLGAEPRGVGGGPHELVVHGVLAGLVVATPPELLGLPQRRHPRRHVGDQPVGHRVGGGVDVHREPPRVVRRCLRPADRAVGEPPALAVPRLVALADGLVEEPGDER